MYKAKTKVGILGGGQLGRMMIEACIDFDVEVSVLDPDENAPCSHFCSKFVCGDYNDFDAVYNFGKNLDIVTIEFENINVAALEKLEQEGVKVFPQPNVIRLIQDKGLQKEFYTKAGIPTAEYRLIADSSELDANVDFLPFFQKLRTAGYDGKGVQKIDSSGDFVNGFNLPSVLEKKQPFKGEISVIVARSCNGEVKCFPVVDQEFNSVANLVEYLFVPTSENELLAGNAETLAIKVANEIGIIGLLAVEMFVMPNGDLLVNEVAPRPHNSGHSSIEANVTSQFEQHLRAILGLPLGSTKLVQAAVMVNLLGEPGFEGDVLYEGIEEICRIEGVHIHLYGKQKTKPYRKMGHINVCADTLEEAKEKAVEVKKLVKVVAKPKM